MWELSRRPASKQKKTSTSTTASRLHHRARRDKQSDSEKKTRGKEREARRRGGGAKPCKAERRLAHCAPLHLCTESKDISLPFPPSFCISRSCVYLESHVSDSRHTTKVMKKKNSKNKNQRKNRDVAQIEKRLKRVHMVSREAEREKEGEEETQRGGLDCFNA
jgi:hypothetical protein